MCGRFTLILDPGDLQEELDLGGIPDDYSPRYNIAPTQPVAVVRDEKSRQVEMFHWGLIPSWAKDKAIGNKLINARAETLAEKPSFRSPFSKRRNLILTSGFYEWRPLTGPGKDRKEPVFIHLKETRGFAFAGLWEEWLSPDGERIHSTTIVTCAANPLIGEFHDRMPVILDKKAMWEWINPKMQLPDLQRLLVPFPPELMAYHPVSLQVNSPRIDRPDLIQPVGQPRLLDM